MYSPSFNVSIFSLIFKDTFTPCQERLYKSIPHTEKVVFTLITFCPLLLNTNIYFLGLISINNPFCFLKINLICKYNVYNNFPRYYNNTICKRNTFVFYFSNFMSIV